MKPFEDIAIGTLVPQQPPFRFVDRLLYCDEQCAEVEFTVPREGIFVSEGRLLAGGLVEHMAQACSAMTGYIAVYIRFLPVSVGYLGHVRSLQVRRLPQVGELLHTRVDVIEDIFGIFMAKVSVCCGDEALAEAIIKTASAAKEDITQ